MKITLTNIQSVKSKDLLLHDHILHNKKDICIMTETWLQDWDSDETWKDMTDLSKNPHKLNTTNRKGRLGGGVTIITKSKLNIHMLDEDQCTMFQYAIWKVSSKRDNYYSHYHLPSILLKSTSSN